MGPLGSTKRKYNRLSRSTLYRRRKERERRDCQELDSSDSSDFEVKPPRKKKLLVRHDENNQVFEDPVIEYDSSISDKLDDSVNTVDNFYPESFSPHSSDPSAFDRVLKEPATEDFPYSQVSDSAVVSTIAPTNGPCGVVQSGRNATDGMDPALDSPCQSEVLMDEDRTCSSYSNLFSDSDGSNCYVAHYLEEDPLCHRANIMDEDDEEDNPDDPDPIGDPSDDSDDNGNRQGGNPGGPGDPDDPDDPDDGEDNDAGSNSSSSESSDDELPVVANFENNDLDIPLELVNPITKGHQLLLDFAAAVRHNFTYEALLDLLRNHNLKFGRCFPESKTKLWSDILLNKVAVDYHVYCGVKECGEYIGKKERLGAFAQCRCGYRVPIARSRFFATLNLSHLLRHLLNIPGIWEHLQYRQRRQKRSPTAIEDVYDGELYKRMQEGDGFLSNIFNFSYVFNHDGVKPSKRGFQKMWVMYIRVNELPPALRQKFTFLVAVYVDYVDPNFRSFMKPFVRQANRLSNRGILWRPQPNMEVRSKFAPMIECVDAPARCGMMCMCKWDSDYGCTFCTHKGKRAGGSQRYPVVDLENIPPYAERTHAGMVADMLHSQHLIHQQRLQHPHHIQAHAVNHVGHRGASPLMLLDHHDMREGQAVDDLHQEHEGCGAHIIDLLLSEAPRVDINMAYADLARRINERLLAIKTPSRISRKPRPIDKRGSYNGTQWRNCLLFYMVPCLTGLIQEPFLNILALLSHGCYLLSTDSIELGDIEEAQQRFTAVAREVELRFGVASMRYNLHVTTSHKCNSVLMLGPAFNHSTYNFESLNAKTVKMVTSPKGALVQIIVRSLIRIAAYSAQYDMNLPEEVRDRVNDMMNKQELKNVHEAGPSIYLVGRPNAIFLNNEEAEVLQREGHGFQDVQEYKSFLIKNTRYKSVAGVDPVTKCDDSFIYTNQDTYCTIRKIVKFLDINGEERCGAFVTEHDVAAVHPVARHISILRDAQADLLHFLPLPQVRLPAIKMHIEGVTYAVSIPNCFEID